MSKVAVLFTGAYRTFDKTYQYILDNILKPNNATAFVLCESPLSNEEFNNSLKSKWNNHIGLVKSVSTTRTEEFNNILEYILKSKEGLSNDNLIKYGYSQNYLKNSGAILEYYQFMKCYELMLEYEKLHNIKFDVIIRSRLDLILTQPLYLNTFFDKLNMDLFNKYGEEVYIRSLGNENMANLLSSNKMVKLFEYQPFIMNTLSYDCTNTLNKINENKYIWTFYCNWTWIAKRHTMDLMYPFVYFYGNIFSDKRDYFNSENQFYDYLQSHNCQIFHFFTQAEWDLWTKNELRGYKTILDDFSLNPEIDKTLIIATIIRH
jgi:hypothetical protein